jgi:MinD-like ATPase involved in chromosome partitioning or flagellar assembly
MYTVTFYSFKGGVGRTLALANLGLGLARTGRKVLLVDFDLEAPGIDTFEVFSKTGKHPGLVEYVSSFIEARVAPDVRDHVYEVTGVAGQGGRLWVMPAGMNDDKYARRLNEINWGRLYEELDGFLMFEDLRAQWKASFNPDYVLVDSRTGHTDIGGICTRQLPDAVAFLFFPNEQNLRGLQPVVSSIRRENKRRERSTETGDNQPVAMHFIMSNVPDLDDEQEILAGMQDTFKRELEYDALTGIIHRYDSLSLLKQSLFITERPKSRLAREYMALLDAITARNVEDRESVIRVLGRPTSSFDVSTTWNSGPEIKIDDILKYHSHDGQILYLLAMNLRRRGRLEESQMLLGRSIELNYDSPEALLAQAETRLLSDEKDPSQIWREVWQAFQSDELSEDELTKGIEILRRTSPDRLAEVVDAPAFRTVVDYRCHTIVQGLLWSGSGMEGALKLLSRCAHGPDMDVSLNSLLRVDRCLALIGLGRFTDAKGLFGSVRPTPSDLSINDAFNYAMAEWGERREIPRDMFDRVTSLDSDSSSREDANYCQCLAIAYWAVGKSGDAVRAIEDAETQVREKPKAEFSCWRYMNVNPPGFLEDCAAIRNLVSGREISPPFFGAPGRNGDILLFRG